MRSAIVFLSLLLFAACAAPRRAAPPQHLLGANDNRTATGSLRNGVLTLRLEIAEGEWQAENALPAWRMLAFAEAGKPATIPGPLIRVPVGSEVDVRIDNRTASDVSIHGLYRRPDAAPPLHVAAHASATTRFVAATAGTYYYWGTLGKPLEEREGRDSELVGALIVDAAGARTDDRIFIITRHGSASEGGDGVGAWAINGRSWPQTERLNYRVGETVSWRLINATGHHHPMHLHGTYFHVIASGDNLHDVVLPPEQQHPVVTQSMDPGSTLAMQWMPRQPGNWLFHCHILFHVMPENRIPEPQWYDEYADLPHDQHMAGLVLGIHVTGTPAPAGGAAARHIALRVAERPGVNFDAYFQRHVPGVGYAVDAGPVTSPGAPLVLERGRPIEIAIHNALTHATTVHWHGIELESYYDGVPHWGTDGTHVTPLIEPGGNFVARFAPPRSGTFIYHTHFNDYAQLTGGLYGALLVVEPGTRLDPTREHVYVLSQGPDEEKDPVLINGSASPSATTWRLGDTHRLRIVGITAVQTVTLRLLQAEQPVTWRPLAKDGADLPDALTGRVRAEQLVAPGETYDFEYVAQTPAPLRLEARIAGAGIVATQVAIAVVP